MGINIWYMGQKNWWIGCSSLVSLGNKRDIWKWFILFSFNGDKDYALVAHLIAKFHSKEISGDKAFTESSKLNKEIQYRIYFDMVENCKWFFKLDGEK